MDKTYIMEFEKDLLRDKFFVNVVLVFIGRMY